MDCDDEPGNREGSKRLGGSSSTTTVSSPPQYRVNAWPACVLSLIISTVCTPSVGRPCGLPAPARASQSLHTGPEVYVYSSPAGSAFSSGLGVRDGSMTMGRAGGAYELGPAGGRGCSRRMAPRLRKREASPVRTRSARTMESSASVGCGPGPGGAILDLRRGTRDGRGL